jgi:heat shock protein 5
MKTSSSSSVLRRAMTSIALVAFVVLAVFTFMPVGANAEVEKDNDFGTVIGIDLGTTYSCVAYVSLAETHDPHLPSCDPFC